MAPDTSRVVTRRKILASSAIGMAGLAGCGGTGNNNKSETPTESPPETPTPTPTPKPEAEFELRGLRSDSIARSGDSLTAAATVANIGDVEGSASIRFSFEGRALVEDVKLEDAEAKSATVEIDVTQVDPGRYELLAEHGDATLSNSVDVFAENLENGLHGAVVSEAGVSLEGSNVDLFVHTGEEFGSDSSRLNSKERFELSHPFEPPYEAKLTFEKGSYGEHNGVPAVYDIENSYDVAEDSELLGRYEIPEAYRTEVQMVDSNGDPMAGFSAVNFRSKGGSGLGPRAFSTDENGYVTAAGSSETGISVPAEGEGDLTVEARPAGGSGLVEFGTIYGSEAGEEFTFSVADPDRFE